MLSDLEVDDFIAHKSTFDLLIDARSPKEYAESHIPNAQNFYALNDAEHQEVGTLYKQVSRNDAKILGARYICQNVALHLQEIAKSYTRSGSKIGIYCARGGLRSSSIAIILCTHWLSSLQASKVATKVTVSTCLTYLETISHITGSSSLGGNTGCGKSELLQITSTFHRS